jgi:hypothetical protein
MRLDLNVVGLGPRGSQDVPVVREETIVYLPAGNLRLPPFVAYQPLHAASEAAPAFISHSPDMPLDFMTNSRTLCWVNSGLPALRMAAAMTPESLPSTPAC